MTPLVSAIIPTYNYGRFVARAVDSVLAQTYPHVECIVVDDGSTDNTREVLARFGERITVVRQANRGLAGARNSGVATSSGECVAFLDADDWWDPRKIESQMALLGRRPEVGCVGCGWQHIYPDGTVEPLAASINRADRTATLRAIALRRFWIGGSGSGALVRRAVLDRVGGFDESLVAAEDWDMWLRLSADTPIDNVPEILVSISRHGSGMFRNAQLMETNQWRVYTKAVAAWPDAFSSRDRRRMRALILADAAGESGGRTRQALSYYLRSLKEWPFSYDRARAAAILTLRGPS